MTDDFDFVFATLNISQLLYSIQKLSITIVCKKVVNYNSYIIWGLFSPFGALLGYFWSWHQVQKLFGTYTYRLSTFNFCFANIAIFLVFIWPFLRAFLPFSGPAWLLVGIPFSLHPNISQIYLQVSSKLVQTKLLGS